MANTYKVLGQTTVTAGGSTANIYTVPANSSAVTSTIAFYNTAGYTGTVNTAVRINGAAYNVNQTILSEPVSGLDASHVIIGMTLSAGDIVTLSATATGPAVIAATLFGTELS